MDADRLTQLEQEAVAQREQNRVLSETLQAILTKINNIETGQNVPIPEAQKVPSRAPTPPTSPPRVAAPSPRQKQRIRPCAPGQFDGDRTKGRMWLTTALLYLVLCQDEFLDDTERVHWAYSFFTSGRASTFAQRMIRMEINNNRIPVYTDWPTFQTTFIQEFCPENESTTAIMRLESSAYYQGKRTVDTYVDEFTDLVSISGYTDPITIVVKFRRGLHPATQDKIAESGSDRPADNDVNGWYRSARRFDQNRLANEAFHVSSWRRAPAATPTTAIPA